MFPAILLGEESEACGSPIFSLPSNQTRRHLRALRSSVGTPLGGVRLPLGPRVCPSIVSLAGMFPPPIIPASFTNVVEIALQLNREIRRNYLVIDCIFVM